jgi:hypothetical protein
MMAVAGRRRPPRWTVPWLAAFVAAALLGCHRESPRRGRVHGSVTVDGVPLAKGQIRLFSLSAGGIGTDGEVVGGRYEIPAARGLTAGTYRVEIVSLEPTGGRVRDPDTNALVDELVNVLPARYHSASELRLTYDPGNDRAIDFELKKGGR